jgi:hypothetical protein
MKILKDKMIIHLITSFNQLHGCQAIRSTYHTTLQAKPCQLVFDRDMFTILTSEQIGINYKKENRTLSISPTKKKTGIEFIMN